jgi:hypothetical protein
VSHGFKLGRCALRASRIVQRAVSQPSQTFISMMGSFSVANRVKTHKRDLRKGINSQHISPATSLSHPPVYDAIYVYAMYMPCTILRKPIYGIAVASPKKHGLQVPEHLRAAERR